MNRRFVSDSGVVDLVSNEPTNACTDSPLSESREREDLSHRQGRHGTLSCPVETVDFTEMGTNLAQPVAKGCGRSHKDLVL